MYIAMASSFLLLPSSSASLLECNHRHHTRLLNHESPCRTLSLLAAPPFWAPRLHSHTQNAKVSSLQRIILLQIVTGHLTRFVGAGAMAEAIPEGLSAASLPTTGVPDSWGTDVAADEVRKVSPHELWVWNAVNHWKHWHGIWVNWQPLESPEVRKIYKSVRSLRAADGPERKHLFHRNQWYSAVGEGGDVNWEFGPWNMYEDTHSLEDGILHPNKDDFRILQFPNGDLGWLQLALKPGDPTCVVFGEVHFMLPSKDGRVAVIMGYDSEDKLGVAQLLEETRESDERPEPSWEGTIWKHHKSALEQTRQEPEGTFVGTEMILTPTLNLTTRKAVWRGFSGGLDEQTFSLYTLVHLPYQFTCLVPKQASVGKEHAFVVNWAVSEDVVRMMSWGYGEHGQLLFVKTGQYQRI